MALVNPNTLIDQNDEGPPGIDLSLQILEASPVFFSPQSFLLGVKNHIHVQRPPGLAAEDISRNFRGGNLPSIESQNSGQGRGAALVFLLGEKGDSVNDPGGLPGRIRRRAGAGAERG